MKVLFWGAAAFIIYTYFGYIGWLWFRARMRPWAVHKGTYEPSVSVVMVVRNEELVLEKKLRDLLAMDYPPDRYDIVVVSDGSTDRTDEILRDQARNPRIHVLLTQLGRGKACGLNDALTLANGEVIMFVDARQRVEAGALRVLVENFADPEVGCVSGALILGDADSGEVWKGMGLYWRLEKKVRELESASGSVVGATGAIYATRRDLLGAVPEGTILDDVYIPMHIVRRGKRAIFDSNARAWDKPNLGGAREFSRKVRTLTGNYQLIQLAPWLLTRDNPIRFEFVSHKLLRLAVPFALAMLLLTCVALSGTFYSTALLLQLIFYALSVLSLTCRFKGGTLARIADAAGTFVLLNSAAVVALANFVSGRRAAWTR
ncbi:MAG TPA: glycosyltransferase family 2 protein [Candidatus Binatia bacterium]|nr:glycosyltransferase family 2 protein [Candidatus Binatia bacterium]